MSRLRLLAIAAAVAAGAVLVVRASSSSAPGATEATEPSSPARERETGTTPMPAPRPELAPAPVATTPAPALPVPGPDGVIETSRATDRKPEPGTREGRVGTGSVTGGRVGGSQLALHQRPNVIVEDPTPEDLVRDKRTKIRMHTIIDRVNCNAPDAKARLEQMTPERRAEWEKRCARVKK